MKRIVLLYFFVTITSFAMSQPNNPSNPVPLDGGLSLLVAGGAALGYKIYKKSKDADINQQS